MVSFKSKRKQKQPRAKNKLLRFSSGYDNATKIITVDSLFELNSSNNKSSFA